MSAPSNGITFSLDKDTSQQREKGKSLLYFPVSFTVLDLETTGLNPAWDGIIEIGMIKVKDGEIIDKFETLVDPEMPIDPFITELTGISENDLKDAPTIDKLCNKVKDFIGADVIVGHNISFDINFLYDAILENLGVKLQNDFINTLRLSHRLAPEIKQHRLGDIANHFNIKGKEHRALYDCELTLKIFAKFRELAVEQGYDLEKGLPQYNKGIDFSAIQGDSSKFKTDHIFFNQAICFTGKLEKLERKSAAQLVADMGGIPVPSVTKKTNFLIVGDFDYNASLKGAPSSKLKKARELKAQGQNIEILSESTFYSLLNDD